ncbi:MAG TPA: DUF6328 family protein [Nannocystis sp.]|jgi:hypothetical protein
MTISDPNRDESQEPDKQVGQLLAEAHMILPGLLMLLGLQIIAVFNDVFQDGLEPHDHALHLVALFLLATGAALVVTPAAYHRQVAPYGIPADFAKLASRFATAALVPLMFALSIDAYLVGKLALGDLPLDKSLTAIAIAVALLMMFSALWFVFPWVMTRRRQRAAR